MKRFLVMLTFLTRIPIRIKFDVEYKDYVRAVGWMGLIAVIIGLPLYFIDMLDSFIQPYVLSFVILIVYLLLSGGLHVDGIADTMDAVGSNRDSKRMLEILSDTKMGTFGVLSIIVYCVGMVIILPLVPRWSLLLFPLVGRCCALICAKTHRYARESGLGKSFVEGVRVWHIFVCILLYLGLYYLLSGDLLLNSILVSLLPFVLAISIVWLYIHQISKKIGGITGDIIGFSIEVTQLAYLLFVYFTMVITREMVI